MNLSDLYENPDNPSVATDEEIKRLLKGKLEQEEKKQLQAPTSGVTNALKPKLPPVKDRYTKEQVEECIERHLGIVTSICNDLDCTYTQFYRAVKHWQLDGAIEEARKTIVAEAEGALLQALRSQDERVRLDAAKYTLARLGKDNGWSENPNVAVAVQVSPSEKQAQIMAIFGIKKESTQEDPEASRNIADDNRTTDT